VNRFLAYLAPAVAVAALFFLPALRLVLPLLPPAQWTVAGMAGDALHLAHPGEPGQPARANPPDLATLLRQAQAMQRQFGGNANPKLKAGFAAAALIPPAALLAGLFALLSWAWLLLGWRVAGLINALCGAAATLYAIAASAWMTALARAAATQAMANMQRNLSGIMRTLDWAKLGRQLTGNIGLVSQPGLYVLLLAFVAILLVPPPGKRAGAPSRGGSAAS
jgi:hypothetical protein